MKNGAIIQFERRPVIAKFIGKKYDKKIHKVLAKQIADYIVANGYLPQVFRRADDDNLEFRLVLNTFVPTNFDFPLKDME